MDLMSNIFKASKICAYMIMGAILRKEIIMSNEILDISELNAVVEETIDALEEGKNKIFEISEQAQNEYKDLESKLHLIQDKVKLP